MTDRAGLEGMSAIRLALMADEARQQALPLLRVDPIAIVGMACRAPGDVKDPASLWSLLTEGKTTSRQVPEDRFDAAAWFDPDPSAPGKIATMRGSFLDQIDQFDPEYFGIPPREVEQMDPQQRLALEVAIEAIDDAGVRHADLRGSRAGMFMAAYHDDYARLVHENVDALDTRTLTGTLHAVTANRISHFLDLRGPSLALDTACSSSLVAIHLACQSLRMGETDFALAGGVSVMITPELFVSMSKVGFMAPDGECKTFDAAADGFGRGEGCSVIALKRLSDAVADGDRVLALIRGSAVNQDGRSTVLTAPNGQAQQAMLQEALEHAALAPGRISFVETHGTGTALGDPIEVEALVNELGGKAGDPPCYLGSIKANIGHLEAAAGVTGLIKAVQVLRHGAVPAQPNFHKLSPHIRLDGSRLAVPTALTPLPATDGPRFASVSSFGVGGTNAHVIIEEAPDLPPPEDVADDAIWMLPLSARSPEGLAELAKRWIERLQDDDASIADLCFTASLRRNHYPIRVAVSGRTKAELRERLEAFDMPTATPAAPKVGFVFSGQGPQWWGMGRGLLAAEPVFRQALEACDAAILKAGGWSVLAELQRPEAESRVAETEIAQPALFALQTALAALWASWGVKPAAVLGHSVGEIAALHQAGALSLEEAARVVVLRGRAMQAATGGGAMAAVALSAADALDVAGDYPGRLDLAAINAPKSTVLSGEPAALDAALAALQTRGVNVRRMQVDYAFHSAQMTDHAEAFAKTLGPVQATRPSTPMISTLTGAAIETPVDAQYFARAIRQPVRFADAVSAMRAAGVDAIVEIGPHPALTAPISETLEADPPRTIVASLRRGRDEPETMRQGLAALYGVGLDPRWSAVQPGEGSVASLPAYPWRRRRLWLKAPRRAKVQTGPGDWIGAASAVAGAGLTIVPLEPAAALDWMDDHKLFGGTLFPAAAMIHAMARAAAKASADRWSALEDFEVRAPLRVEGADDQWQVVVTDAGETSFYARGAGQSDWRLIAKARAVAAAQPQQPAAPSAGEAADLRAFYARMAAGGVEFGTAFQRLTEAKVQQDGAVGRAGLPEPIDAPAHLHPVLLDAGLQLVSVAAGPDGTFLPLSIDRVWLAAAAAPTVELAARIVSRSDAAIAADILAYAPDGALVAALQGVNFVRATAEMMASGGQAAAIHELEWKPLAAGDDLAKSWLILDDAKGVADALETALAGAGVDVARLAETSPDALAGSADAVVACLWPLDPADADAPAYGRMLTLLQDLAAQGPRQLVVIGHEGEAASGLAMLAQVASLEHPELSVRTVLVDPLATPDDAAAAIVRGLRTPFVPLATARADEVQAPRLRVALTPATRAEQVVQSGEGLDGVTVQAMTPPAPGAGEILLRVRAAGLNFRDTLVALGAYPGQPPPFGAECAGVVEALGAGVTGFAVGDRVVSLAGASLRGQAVVRADLSVLLPPGVSFEVAGATPVAFLTADIGLNHFGRMKAGDRVLIHAATGGVGLAAVALAQRAGAEVFSTAGTPEKRAYLRGLGVKHIFDSRSLDFGDQVLAATDGAGVRLVLNSLTGAFVGASLKALAKDGVLLELGKREIWTPEEVAAVRPDAGYHVFDAGTMAEAEPALLQDCLAQVLPALAAGEIAPPPLDVRPLAQAQDALRRMAQAKHMGKLVLAIGPSAADAAPVRADGAYLISGGLGGVGLGAARWLAARGARRLVLVGRRNPDAAAAEAIDALRADGVEVRAVAADIADETAMAEVIAQIVADAPLRGIVHAAGASHNALVRDLDAADIAAVRRGKVEGAQVLRRLTKGMALDFVVLCAAAANLFGAPGQGAYAAVNAELEALGLAWRRDGTLAMSIAWGPWRDAGMFAAMGDRAKAAWAARGLIPMTEAEAFAGLDRAIAGEVRQALAANVDWTKALADEGVRWNLDLFAAMRPKAAPAAAAEPAAQDGLEALRALPAALRRSALVEAIAVRARTVLDLPKGAPLAAGSALKDIGLDSLMAVELRNHLARFGGVALPATLAFDHPTLDALADRLGVVWSLQAAPEPAAAPAAATVEDDLDGLSEEDLEAMLAAELNQLSEGASS